MRGTETRSALRVVRCANLRTETTAGAGGWIAEGDARMSWDNCWVRMVQQQGKALGQQQGAGGPVLVELGGMAWLGRSSISGRKRMMDEAAHLAPWWVY